jgi:hypothetical protein
MIRLAALLLVIMISLSVKTAVAAPAPVCRLATVMDVMERELRMRAYYAHLDPRFIDEAPTPNPQLMHCKVCAKVVVYDTSYYGSQPLVRCEAHTFSIRAVRNGFVVRYLQ